MNSITNQVTLFQFQQNQIRVVSLEGNPWFVATDVLYAIGLSQNSHGYAVAALDADQSSLYRIQKGVRSQRIISESGLYKLIMRSDKPQAKPFQDWVTQEVLPSIRKTGAYVTGQPSLKENPRRCDSIEDA